MQPEEEVKKAMDIEVVDSTEMACASVINTAIDNNSIKVKDEVHITKILKPTELSASSSPATDNIQHVFITFKALRFPSLHVPLITFSNCVNYLIIFNVSIPIYTF